MFCKSIVHAGNVLKDELKIKALRNKISKFVFVFPRKIFLGIDKPDEAVFYGPDGPVNRDSEERPLRGMTPQGEKVFLARSDTILAGRSFEFEIHVLAPGIIAGKTIRAILDYGQYQGLGQEVSGALLMNWKRFPLKRQREKSKTHTLGEPRLHV